MMLSYNIVKQDNLKAYKTHWMSIKFNITYAADININTEDRASYFNEIWELIFINILIILLQQISPTDYFLTFFQRNTLMMTVIKIIITKKKIWFIIMSFYR